MKSYISRKLPVATRMTALILAVRLFESVTKVSPLLDYKIRRQWKVNTLPCHVCLSLPAEDVSEELSDDRPRWLLVDEYIDSSSQRITTVLDIIASERNIRSTVI